MALTHDLDIDHRPLADLKPHPANPRNGDTALIAESLSVNGQYRPIVTTTDGTILAGNHTYAAAAELGYESIACVVLNLDPSSPEAMRIMLADNRTSDVGRYDEPLLLRLIDALDGDLEGSGYHDDGSLALLRRKVEADLTMGLDLSTVQDEFMRDTAFDREQVEHRSFDTIQVSFRDEAARSEFFAKIGYEYTGQSRLRYPADYKVERVPDSEL